VRGRSKEE